MAVDWVAGGAASLAAIFSGLTLATAPRRERQKWAREASIASYQTFFDSSFEINSACKAARAAIEANQPVAEYEAVTDRGHKVQNHERSKLRLLAPDDVVKALTDLHDADDRLVALSFQVPPCPQPDWIKARQESRKAKTELVRNVRRSLKLSDGPEVVGTD